MIDKKDKENLFCGSDLDPRYQTLLEEFRLAAIGENLEPVENYLLMLNILHQTMANRQAFFNHFNLSEGKFSVLLLLKNAPGKQLTPSEIAKEANVTRGTITGLLAGLERDHLVIRNNDPHDGRRNTITLSTQAEKLLEQVIEARYGSITGLFSCFSPEELLQMRRIWIKLWRKLSTFSPV